MFAKMIERMILEKKVKYKQILVLVKPMTHTQVNTINSTMKIINDFNTFSIQIQTRNPQHTFCFDDNFAASQMIIMDFIHYISFPYMYTTHM